MTYTCTQCGDTYTEPVPAADHTAEEVTVSDATIFAEGSKQSICTVCGDPCSDPIATEKLVGVVTLGAQALSVTWDSIRFAGSYNVSDMKATFEDGDVVDLAIYMQLKTKVAEGTMLDETNAVKLANTFTWKAEYETMTTEELVAALRAEGAKINNYTDDEIIVAARINNVPSEEYEFVFRAAIERGDDFKGGDQFYNSIKTIRDAVENGIGDGASVPYPEAQ